MGQQGKPKMVWRKRRNPDGSYEWILDTPDWYERELKRKQFGDPVIDALLQVALAVNKVVTRLFYSSLRTAGKMLEEHMDRTLSRIDPPRKPSNSLLVRAGRRVTKTIDNTIEWLLKGNPVFGLLRLLFLPPLLLLAIVFLLWFLQWVIDWHMTYVF